MTNIEEKAYHRPDIQGLRGVAVLLVVIYHTGVALPGGFIGVDMFFVISGFVITQVLLREFEETGTIRLRNFYARRARRLIPAVGLVLLFTLAASLLLMRPSTEWLQVAHTAIASIFFSTNIFFIPENYSQLTENPLRHLWSLGVEEQFYWFFPLLPYFFLRKQNLIRSTRALITCLACLVVASLTLCVVLSNGFNFGYSLGSRLAFHLEFLEHFGVYPYDHWPQKVAFFSSPTRFWEILSGALVALSKSNSQNKKLYRVQILKLVGWSGILGSIFLLRTSMKFPGLLAVIPVLSTVVLLYCGQDLRFKLNFLNSKIMKFFGDISYSWYLWHWPLIVFIPRVFPAIALIKPMAAFLSVIPAYASFRFIEQRFRSQHAIRNQNMATILTFVITPLMFSLLVASGGTDFIKGGLLPKYERSFALNNDCASVKFKKDWVASCTFGKSSATFRAVVIGDSHAGAASDAVFEVIDNFGGELLVAPASSCPFLLDIKLDDLNCEQLNKDRALAINKYKPQVVYLANDYLFLLSRDAVDMNDVSNHFRQTLKWLSDAGVLVIVQGQVPTCEYEMSVLNKFLNHSMRCLDSGTSKLKVDEISGVLKPITNKFANIEFLDPLPLVCPSFECAPFRGEMSIFEGRTHLTVSANKLLKPEINDVVVKFISQGAP